MKRGPGKKRLMPGGPGSCGSCKCSIRRWWWHGENSRQGTGRAGRPDHAPSSCRLEARRQGRGLPESLDAQRGPVCPGYRLLMRQGIARRGDTRLDCQGRCGEAIGYSVIAEPDTVDAQSDVMSAETIEEMAHNFLLHSRKFDNRHDWRAVDAAPVESWIQREATVLLGRRSRQNRGWWG